MALLKDLVDNDLVEPSYVSLVQVDSKHFQIQMKCDYNKEQIQAYTKKHGLTIKEDKDRKLLVDFQDVTSNFLFFIIYFLRRNRVLVLCAEGSAFLQWYPLCEVFLLHKH